MPARTCGDRDQSIRAFFDRFFGKAVVDNIMQGDAAAAMGGVIDLDEGPQRCNPDRYFLFGAYFNIAIKPRI